LSSERGLKIVHVLRAPLGGLFRHVIDLSIEQAARGHKVGLFFDSQGDGRRAREQIARIPGGAELGVETVAIQRNPHFSDATALLAFFRFLRRIRPDVVHGHGSKGGLYARLARLSGAGRMMRAYTPHGGSFNYAPGSLAHRLYMAVERAIEPLTDLYLFESRHIGEKFAAYVGGTPRLQRVVVNGLGPHEFAPIAPASDAADILYVGELRWAKGVDTLISALAIIRRETGRTPSAAIVGSGPDLEALIERTQKLGLLGYVRFLGPMRVAQAFTLGRLMVAPSRAESMPYIVLETVAAHVPLLTTEVGGVPEIFGPYRDRLVPPDDPNDLARRILVEWSRAPETRAARAAELAAYVRNRFSLENMAETVLSAYREALGDPDAKNFSHEARHVADVG